VEERVLQEAFVWGLERAGRELRMEGGELLALGRMVGEAWHVLGGKDRQSSTRWALLPACVQQASRRACCFAWAQILKRNMSCIKSL
jgi:hypothetical protein